MADSGWAWTERRVGGHSLGRVARGVARGRWRSSVPGWRV